MQVVGLKLRIKKNKFKTIERIRVALHHIICSIHSMIIGTFDMTLEGSRMGLSILFSCRFSLKEEISYCIFIF